MHSGVDQRNFSKSANSTLRRNPLLPLRLSFKIDQAFRSSSFVGESNFAAGNSRTAHSASAHNKSSDATFLVQGNNDFEIHPRPSRLFPSREGSRKPEENLHMSLERPPSQPGAHTAFKSTLANLSAGLATLDEGEYLQWGGDKSHVSSNHLRNSHKKATLKSRERSSMMRNGSQNNSTTIEANTLDESVLLKKTIDHSSPLEKRIKVNKVKDLLELSKIDNNNNENLFKELFDDVGAGAVKPIKARAGSLRGDIGNWKSIKSIQNHLGIDASSDLMVISDRISGILGSCNRSDLEIGAQTPEVNETIRQSFSGSLRRSGKFRPWRADTAEKNERKTSVVKIVTPADTQASRKGDIVLPKFNVGGYLAGESIATKASNQGDGLSFGYSAGDLKSAEPGWAFSGQWRARKTLYSFEKKENSRRILRERSLEKARESSPQQKTKKEGERSFSSYEKILKEMESAEELKNRGHIGRVVWDESDLYKVQKTETSEMAEKFFLDQNKVGLFPTLTPKLPAKRDFIGVRKHLLPFRAKDRVFDEILKDSERTGFLDELGKSLRDTEPRRDGIEQPTSRKKRLNSTAMNNEEQAITRAQAMLEERMKMLEEKYTRVPENKETISPREEIQDLRENNKSMIEEMNNSSSRKKRLPGLSVDSNEAKKKLRGLRNILKLIK